MDGRKRGKAENGAGDGEKERKTRGKLSCDQQKLKIPCPRKKEEKNPELL